MVLEKIYEKAYIVKNTIKWIIEQIIPVKTYMTKIWTHFVKTSHSGESSNAGECGRKEKKRKANSMDSFSGAICTPLKDLKYQVKDGSLWRKSLCMIAKSQN